MVREYSAGGIVFKKVPTSSNLLWLVAQHSHHKGWVFPKGLIGDHNRGESSRQTAVREVREETGITGKIIAKLKNPATYFYTRQGEKRFKTVIYYLMEYVSGDIADHDWEMSQVEWLKEKDVEKKLTFKSDKIAFKQALEIVKK